MRKRRVFGFLLAAAGLALCAAAGIHYLRGALAQRSGQIALSKARESARAPTAAAPAGVAPTSSDYENPSVAVSSSESAPPTPTRPAYPYGQPIARIRIASAEIDAIVFGGSDQASLEKGPGHVPGTALPGVDGPPNNCVITGHRDSHFRHLGWLRKGHTIELETPSGDRTYRIVGREIVTPDAVSVLAPTEKPRLTLITCYPFDYIGPAPKRLVLIAEPVATSEIRHHS